MFLQRKSQSTIWPSEHYSINLWKPTEKWEDGEFCPAQINPKSELMQFDGMYGLTNDIYAVLGVVGSDEPTPAAEATFEKEYGKYMDVVYASVKRGITHGTLNGIAGPRNWQIVYLHRAKDGSWTNSEPVIPGKQYGDRITPEGDRSTWPMAGPAQEVAEAILEGEDPKKVFQQMREPEPIYRISISSWNKKRKKQIGLGSFDLDASTGKITNERYSPQLRIKPDPEDLTAILTSLRKHRTGMAGSYPGFGKLFYWQAELISDLSRYRPMLMVEGPGWTISGPLLKGTEPSDYIWRFHDLTPEQHAVLVRFGEFIHYAMNEGDTFKGELEDEPWDGPSVKISWYVRGNPELAPKGSWAGTDWSGQARPLP